MIGFIYAIQAGDAVKIGWAADPARRLSELNVGSPGDHRLLGFVGASKNQERELHALLSPWRIRGEWFSISNSVVAHFINLLPPFRPAPKQRIPVSIKGEHSKLAQYLIDKQISPSEFARQLGVPNSTVHRWVHGKRAPSGDSLVKIEAATSGEVKFGDFFPAETEAAE